MKKLFRVLLGTLLVGGSAIAYTLAQGVSVGEDVFNSNCSSCHQTSGQGLTGAFPPLVEHVPAILAAEEGRDYLVNLLLYGLQGEIQVRGATYNGVMPAWHTLSDEELASALNYVVTAWGNESRLPDGFYLYTPEEITSARDAGLTAWQVYSRRKRLGVGNAQ